ncbi:Cob(I)yrinic acid a,c-diamide adenosyltransferase, mitochondrial [Orchesella cincta]|uniref:Corrinoid adenosyltransferase MMAB n=1 Tax=Orchesella cincta TaxID=48709 RepID=A0A1D2NA56_ORCCI|nr:Cob(I)yrinic acid a,c-diamide adenosyltransferase, mitochondrial [Orchesella cincta]
MRLSVMVLPVTRSIATTDWNAKTIYTKTGDKGFTSLLTGKRLPKDDRLFEALGTIEELSSHIALACEFAREYGHGYNEKFRRIQCILQDIVSMIATPKSSANESQLKGVGFSDRHVKELEEWIDRYMNNLPPFEKVNVILPGGGKPNASLHIARTVCRRAERAIIPLVRDNEVDEQALIYLNRLSDYLFTVARYAAKLDRQNETIYIRENPPT